MQELIDDGVHLCQRCESFGRNDFCGDCGARFFGHDRTWRECTTCKVECSTTFCPLCGRELDSEELQRWEAGDVDLEEEGRRAQRQIGRLLVGNDALDRALFDGDLGGLQANRARGLADVINEGFGISGEGARG